MARPPIIASLAPPHAVPHRLKKNLASPYAPPPAQANNQCCEDNPDALTHHEVLLPGHLLLKFLKEQLETCLDTFRAQVCEWLPTGRGPRWVSGGLDAGRRAGGQRVAGWANGGAGMHLSG